MSSSVFASFCRRLSKITRCNSRHLVKTPFIHTHAHSHLHPLRDRLTHWSHLPPVWLIHPWCNCTVNEKWLSTTSCFLLSGIFCLRSLVKVTNGLVVFSGPSLNVVAKTNREASVGGATFEMSCTVATENLGEVGYSVLIQSQESLQSNVRTIMTLSPNNVLQHGGATDPNRRCTLTVTCINVSKTLEFYFEMQFFFLLYPFSQGQSGSDKVWSVRVSVSPGRRPAVRQGVLLVWHHSVDKAAARTGLDKSHQRRVQQSPDWLSRKWWVDHTSCFWNLHNFKLQSVYWRITGFLPWKAQTFSWNIPHHITAPSLVVPRRTLAYSLPTQCW